MSAKNSPRGGKNLTLLSVNFGNFGCTQASFDLAVVALLEYSMYNQDMVVPANRLESVELIYIASIFRGVDWG